VDIFSFLLLRPSKTSEALKKGPNFGFLTFKLWLVWKKCPVSIGHPAIDLIIKSESYNPIIRGKGES
jgi:hypothetical protein